MRFFRWSGVALLALACVAANAGINNWSSRGPDGGNLADVKFDPSNGNVVYVSAVYALFKSTDGGVNWVVLPQDLGRSVRSDVTVDPSNPARVYATSASDGLFRSTDGGASFTRITALPTDPNVEGPARFAISADGNTLYYSTYGRLFFRSTDAGATFTAGASTSAFMQALIIDPADNRTLYAAAGSQLLKSTDGGGNWLPLPHPAPGSGPTPPYISGLVFVPGVSGAQGTLWVSAGNVFSTQNDGTTWTAANPPLSGSVLAQDPNSPSTLYAVGAFGGSSVQRLQGGTWQALGTLPDGVIKMAVAPGNSQVILAATTSGMYRSVNGGATWSRSDTGLTAVRVDQLISTAGSVYSSSQFGQIGIGEGDSLMRRETVRSLLSNPGHRSIILSLAVRPSDPNFIMVGFANSAGYRYTVDGGSNWNDGSPSLANSTVNAIAIAPSDESIVYAASHAFMTPTDSIQRSTDGGLTFDPVASNLGNIWARKLVVDPQNPARLFLLSSEALNTGDVRGLLRSNDSGATWTRVHELTGDFALDPTDSRRVYGADGARFLLSENGGDSFENIYTFGSQTDGFQFVLSIAVDPVASNVVYAATVKSTGPPANSVPEYFVMRSVDRGRTWERLPNSSFQNWSPWRLAVNSALPTVLMVGSAVAGVFSFQIAPDLAASIVGHEGPKPIGVETFYEVRAQNTGPFAATNVVFSSTFPAGAQNVSASIPNGTCSVGATSVQCSLPTLALNGVASARVNYTAPAGGALPVQASVAAREADPVTSNNSATASATAMETIDLVVTGSATPSSPERGSAVAYTFQVRNAGPNASSVTRLTMAAGAGLTVTSASPAACTVSGAAVTCDFGTLASNATASATVNTTSSVAGNLRMTGTAGRATSAADLDSSNDTANVDVVAREPTTSGGGGNTGGGGGGGGGLLSIDVLIILAMIAILSARTRRAARRASG